MEKLFPFFLFTIFDVYSTKNKPAIYSRNNFKFPKIKLETFYIKFYYKTQFITTTLHKHYTIICQLFLIRKTLVITMKLQKIPFPNSQNYKIRLIESVHLWTKNIFLSHVFFLLVFFTFPSVYVNQQIFSNNLKKKETNLIF